MLVSPTTTANHNEAIVKFPPERNVKHLAEISLQITAKV